MRFQEQDLSNTTREIPFINKPRIIRFPNIKVRIDIICLKRSQIDVKCLPKGVSLM